MAEPKCPECGMTGMDALVSPESQEASEGGDPWFSVVYCDGCGHIYGVFAKHVMSHKMGPPGF